MSKTDVVPAPFELTDYGRDRKVPVTKEFDKCHRGICPDAEECLSLHCREKGTFQFELNDE